MKIIIGTDHAGFKLKEVLVHHLQSLGYQVDDKGAYEYAENDDYPDFIGPVALAVAKEKGNADVIRGIVIGGSGQGEAMFANRFPHVRAVVLTGKNCTEDMEGDLDKIKLSRKHNNSNILSLAARFLSEEEAKMFTIEWIETSYNGEEKYQRRIDKTESAMEQICLLVKEDK